MSIDLQPINSEARAKDPFGDNEQARVVPKSMAGEIKPDPNLPPAGHKRDEFLRARRDRLEKQIAQMPELSGGVDVSEIPIENEIAHAFDDMGNLSVSKMKPDYVYKWKKADDKQVAMAQNLGFEFVSGDPRSDPKCPNTEGIEHIGKHAAAGTTLRGGGDVLLCRMKRERYEKLENYLYQRGLNLQQVEANFEDYGADLAARGLIPQNLAHGRRSDPLIQRVFPNGENEARRMDRTLRAGDLPGATVNEMFRR
jgi:hypothetical protein